MARAAREWVSLRKMLRTALPLNESPLAAEMRAIGIDFELRRAPRLFESAGISAPAVVGAWQPAILLPQGFAQNLSPTQVQMALAHELAHIRRRDLWLGLIPGLAHVLFWFFPPAWLACREWETTREAAREVTYTEIAAKVFGCPFYEELLPVVRKRVSAIRRKVSGFGIDIISVPHRGYEIRDLSSLNLPYRRGHRSQVCLHG